MPHPRWSLLAWIALLFGLATFEAFPRDPAGKPPAGKPNRLAKESSPYLRLHAHNPVDWYPWGEEAFAKAKRENKLVFLSIGYSSCYWCHVMERESFANPEAARLMNQHFVCIKVDREERPDVDNIYMAVLQVQGQSGGWPLSLFLLPDGTPISGGTYWPLEDKEINGVKRRGFKTILTLVQEDWVNKREGLEKYAKEVADTVRRALGTNPGPPIRIARLDASFVQECVDTVTGEFDKDFGGFGNAEKNFRGSKFPRPSVLELLLQQPQANKDQPLSPIVKTTLDRMALGGIYDHLGGGFHRYTVDREWKVPHFEKMLYDNAQLVSVYCRAYAATKDPLYLRVVEESLDYVTRTMTSPDGAFYTAQDAETEAEEGKYYVWTKQELERVLTPEELKVATRAYGLDQMPNFEHKAYVLQWPKPQADVAKDMGITTEVLLDKLRPIRTKLLALRNQRPAPLLDTKVLTGWNGLMIAGYAEAATALEKPAYSEVAARAAKFLLTNLRKPDGGLWRTYSAVDGGKGEAKLNGYLEDYAFLTHGLLALHAATKDPQWLAEAKKLTDVMLARFYDKDAGGFFYTSDDHEKLFVRSKDHYDGSTPSSNSVATLNLVRLAKLTGDKRYAAEAERTLKSFAPGMLTNPSGFTFMARALATWLEGRPPEAQDAVASHTAKDDQVELTAEVSPKAPGADGKQTVTITMTMAKGWHTYANPAGIDELAPTTVAITSGKKLEAVDVAYPKGEDYRTAAVNQVAKVYHGTVTIKATVQRTKIDGKFDDAPLDVKVRYQACDDKACQLPKTVSLRPIELTVKA